MIPINIIRLLCLAMCIGLSSCSGTASESHEHTTHQEEHPHEHGEDHVITLTHAQVASVGIETGSIAHKNIAATIKVNGSLALPAQNKASVTSLYGGVLRSIHVHPGSSVRKGQIIATIVNTELSDIQQQLISVNASLRLAELEQARQQQLVEGNAAPLKNLQRAQAELRSLRAQKAALHKQLSTLGISPASVGRGNISSTLSITAPISGTISDIHGQIGSRVDMSTPLAEIVNNSQLHLDLFVYEKDLPAIRNGQVIHFTLTNNPGREYDARIFSVGTAFANETKAVPVHAEVEGDKTGLIEGMSVTALISIGAQTSPAVPTEAIVSAGGKDYIFICTDKPTGKAGGTSYHFERVEIARGKSDLGFTEITPVQEIQDDAAVVVKGAFFLMAKMTNTGEHEH